MWVHKGVYTHHVRMHWKVTLGRKSLAAPGNWTCGSGMMVRCSNQLSYIPTSMLYNHQPWCHYLSTVVLMLHFVLTGVILSWCSPLLTMAISWPGDLEVESLTESRWLTCHTSDSFQREMSLIFKGALVKRLHGSCQEEQSKKYTDCSFCSQFMV